MYNRFVNAFIDAQTESLRLYREVVRAEAAVFGASYAGQVVRVPTTGEIVNELRVVYESVITRIIDRARTQYAVGRARPVVNRAAVCKEAGIDIDRAMAMGTRSPTSIASGRRSTCAFSASAAGRRATCEPQER
jgi:hypothetical protein